MARQLCSHVWEHSFIICRWFLITDLEWQASPLLNDHQSLLARILLYVHDYPILGYTWAVSPECMLQGLINMQGIRTNCGKVMR